MNRGQMRKIVGALASVALLAGCAGVAQQRGASEIGGAWPMFKADALRQGAWRGKAPQPPLQVRWRYTPEGITNGFLDWGPVASRGVVYTPNGLNRVIALDALSGAVRWEQTLEGNVFNVALAERHGVLLATTTITARPTPTLYALDLATGAIRWHNMAHEQPALGGIEGAVALTHDTAYVAWLRYEGDGGVAAYALRDGRLRWRWIVPQHSALTPVAAGQGYVFVGTDDKRLQALDARTGALCWRSEPYLDVLQGAPMIAEGLVIMAAGPQVQAHEVRTGRVVWQQALLGVIGSSSPARYEDMVVVGTQQSQLLAVALKDGQVRWQQALEAGPIESSPAIDEASGLAYVGTGDNSVLVVEARTGVVRDRVRLAPAAAGVWHSSPALQAGGVYIGSLDKTLYALGSGPAESLR